MMLSPRRPYVSPEMRRNYLFDANDSSHETVRASFDGLEPGEAAKLFSELITAQV